MVGVLPVETGGDDGWLEVCIVFGRAVQFFEKIVGALDGIAVVWKIVLWHGGCT